jgi:hypothetical protein
MQKSELQQIDSRYKLGLIECINKARELGELLRKKEITQSEHDMLLDDLRKRARERNGNNDNTGNDVELLADPGDLHSEVRIF